MNKKLLRIRDDVHLKLLDFRNIEQLISRAEFDEKFCSSDQQTQDLILDAARRGDYNYIRKWFESKRSLYELSVNELRRIAQSKYIRDYHLLKRDELIMVLEKKNGKAD